MTPPRPPTDVDALRDTLLGHARTVVAREGVDGLTMRALAAEAGTAVGLSYKAFSSREELVRELTWRSLRELATQIETWAARPGGRLVDRLMEFSDLQVASDAPALVSHLTRDPGGAALLRQAVEAGVTRSWASVMSEFLAGRQRDGLLREDVDVEAFAFILTAAMHYVLVTDEPFSAPDRATLARHVAGVAAQIDVDR